MDPPKNRLSFRQGVVGSLLLGVGLRLYGLGSEALWVDEGWSLADATSRPLLDLLVLPASKLHMPLYYLVLRYWTAVFGTGEVSLRFPSVAFGVATIAGVAVVGRRLYDPTVGVLSSLFLALSSFHVYYSQEARMYALAVLLTVGSVYYLLRATETDSAGDWTGYVVVTVLLGLSHPSGLLAILAQNVFVGLAVLAGCRGSPTVPLRRWVAAQTVVGTVLGPWYVLFLGTLLRRDAGGTVPGDGVPSPSDVLYTPVVFLTDGVTGLVTYEVAVVLTGLVGACVVVGVWGATVAADPRSWRPVVEGETPIGRESLLVGCWLAVPILVPVAVSSLGIPLFDYRYVLPALPGLVLALAKGVRGLRFARVDVVVCVVLVVAMVGALPGYYGAVQKQQWDRTGEYVAANADRGDLVVLGQGGFTQGGARAAFELYYDGGEAPVRTLPLTATRADLGRLETARGDVWLVVTGGNPGEYRDFLRVLNRSHRLVETRRFRSDRHWHVQVYHYGWNGTRADVSARLHDPQPPPGASPEEVCQRRGEGVGSLPAPGVHEGSGYTG